MSDTKQQCPTCLEPVVNGNCPYFHTQPSAAGSGPREWLHNVGDIFFDGDQPFWCWQMNSQQLAGHVIRTLEVYADHCTAQKEAELTAERTRREAAERELARLQHEHEVDTRTVQRLVATERELRDLGMRVITLARLCEDHAYPKPQSEFRAAWDELRAALRGKEGE